MRASSKLLVSSPGDSITQASYSQLGTSSENVYFQLSGTPAVSAAPEASSLTLLATGLLVMGIIARAQERRSWRNGHSYTQP